jgi:hypothetical protein
MIGIKKQVDSGNYVNKYLKLGRKILSQKPGGSKAHRLELIAHSLNRNSDYELSATSYELI